MFGRKTAPEELSLADHLARIKQGRQDGIAGLVGWLAGQPLWIGVRELPPGAVPGVAVAVERETPVQMLTTTLPEDLGLGLQVFSREAGVYARNPAAFAMMRPGRDILADVIANHDGLVLDSSGPTHQVLLSAWIRDVL